MTLRMCTGMKTLGTAEGLRNRVREADAQSGDLNVLLRCLSVFPLIASLGRLG